MKFLLGNKTEKSHEVTRQEALRCTPLVNTSVESTELDTGEILVEFPLLIKPLFHSLLSKFVQQEQPMTKKLQLDEMGSWVWKMIDGEKSVQDIINTFAGEYNISLQEAEKSVTTFLLELGRRGIIAMR